PQRRAGLVWRGRSRAGFRFTRGRRRGANGFLRGAFDLFDLLLRLAEQRRDLCRDKSAKLLPFLRRSHVDADHEAECSDDEQSKNTEKTAHHACPSHHQTFPVSRPIKSRGPTTSLDSVHARIPAKRILGEIMSSAER